MGKDHDLAQAVRDQDASAVERILTKNRNSKKIKRLNVNQQDVDGMSVLHHAALLGSVDILKLLLEYGALFDTRDAKGLRPLHYAAWQGHCRSTEMLLTQGSSVNDAAIDGNTPLHLACEHGHSEVIKKLLHFGADVCLANAQHRTSLDLACEFGRIPVVERLLESERCRHLLQDTSADMADNNRTTCLHLAARNGHVDIIRLLLSAGININRQTLQGTCLHEAAKYGKTEVVRLLLSSGVDVTRLNSYEQTALEIVNKFTATRAAKELKQMLKDASSEIRIQGIQDCAAGSSNQNAIAFKDANFVTDQKGGMSNSHRNGLDGHKRVPPSHTKSFQWNRSSPQPSPVHTSQFVGNGGRTVGTDDSFPPPPSPLAKLKATSQDLSVNSGNLSSNHRSSAASLQKGKSVDQQSSQSGGWSGLHLIASDDTQNKDGSNHRMSSGSSGSGSYQSTSSQMSGGSRQNRLSGQSCESGVSGISSSRQSYHSSSSSQGSLDHLEESGYSSTVNVHELLQQGLSDIDILRTWLSSLHLEELTSLFVDAGYDMPTISRMTPEDLTAIGITQPSVRKKLKSEISKLSIGDGIPDFRPKDLADWLHSLHLDGYLNTLVQQGYGTLDAVTDITWEDLEEVGIKKLGHQKKMMLAIDRLTRINSMLHRLSNPVQSSVEAVNRFDSHPPPVSSSLSYPASSASSLFASASIQHHPPAAAAALHEASGPKSWKPGPIPSGRQIFTVEQNERSGFSMPAGSVEIHPLPMNSKRSPGFPVSNMTSINHNTYPDLPKSSCKVGSGNDNGSSLGRQIVLDGDATPTNERKVVPHSEWKSTKIGMVRCSREEPFNLYHAEQNVAKENGLLNYSTLPKKFTGKHKMLSLDNDFGHGFQPSDRYIRSNNMVPVVNKQISRDISHNHITEQPTCSGITLTTEKRDPPPPPKRSDSFKTDIRSVLGAIGGRHQASSDHSAAVSTGALPVPGSNPREDLKTITTDKSKDLTKKPAASTTPGASASLSCAEKPSAGSKHERQRQTGPGRSSGNANNQGSEWQDGQASECSDDSDSGLESRHSASTVSLESSGSGGTAESNTLPFANENVGTIKQRNPTAKPSILASSDGDASVLNMSLFDNGAATLKRNSRTNPAKLDNGDAPGPQFSLVNGEIISDISVNNGNLSYGSDADVFNDIDGMLNGLTQELDEMLKLHG